MGDELWHSIINQVHFIESSIVNPLASRVSPQDKVKDFWKIPPQGFTKLNVDGSHGIGN